MRYLQYRRNFFFMYSRPASHARGKGSGGKFGCKDVHAKGRVCWRKSLCKDLFLRPLCLSGYSRFTLVLLLPQFAWNAKNSPVPEDKNYAHTDALWEKLLQLLGNIFFVGPNAGSLSFKMAAKQNTVDSSARKITWNSPLTPQTRWILESKPF